MAALPLACAGGAAGAAISAGAGAGAGTCAGHLRVSVGRRNVVAGDKMDVSFDYFLGDVSELHWSMGIGDVRFFFPARRFGGLPSPTPGHLKGFFFGTLPRKRHVQRTEPNIVLSVASAFASLIIPVTMVASSRVTASKTCAYTFDACSQYFISYSALSCGGGRG